MNKVLQFCINLFCCLLILSVLAGGFCVYLYYTEYQPRAVLKSYCHDADCRCFNNLVDYRFTKSQIKSFSRYLESLQVRKETQLLEFTSFEDVKEILSLLQICQPKRVLKQEMIKNDELNPTDSSLPKPIENDLG